MKNWEIEAIKKIETKLGEALDAVRSEALDNTNDFDSATLAEYESKLSTMLAGTSGMLARHLMVRLEGK